MNHAQVTRGGCLGCFLSWLFFYSSWTLVCNESCLDDWHCFFTFEIQFVFGLLWTSKRVSAWRQGGAPRMLGMVAQLNPLSSSLARHVYIIGTSLLFKSACPPGPTPVLSDGHAGTDRKDSNHVLRLAGAPRSWRVCPFGYGLLIVQKVWFAIRSRSGVIPTRRSVWTIFCFPLG